ncbi:anhydro-N-acetylmuramic acid kinase [Ferruginibacter albus]|uniref:anhydro-N-acetylmuramic acid kinase n=1 Tax=Ferruginibacter albus TaxID=2875540 RepID=UPI001CC5D436|nr:anhydro-N-acetylmuramic acid kinase [Ferruginibacter albus]UAY51405.1 anhydro-N-acetylmuramic acid kinase [Ferruginibacter albus]
MLYKVVGIMSGSSLDGLDIAYVHLQETGGKWGYEIIAADCYSYTRDWKNNLSNAVNVSALEYQLLHTRYGHFIGNKVNDFIEKNNLHHKVDLVASHGHTVFHLPLQKMTAQIGCGAAIAAATNLPVVSDLRSMDVALGGQGAPIVPIGHKLLFKGYDSFLNIGGIANISFFKEDGHVAYDVCPANRVLNSLAAELNVEFDKEGMIAASGNLNEELLKQLNNLEYYSKPYPKSLDNSFGINEIMPLIKKHHIATKDAIRTYTEHICVQLSQHLKNNSSKLLVTGGGAYNSFLIDRLKALLPGIEIVVPDNKLIEYKEALIMALIGALRWREEVNVMTSVTGATRASSGGALWLGSDN